MRVVRFKSSGKIRYGVIKDELVYELQGSPFRNFKGPGGSFPLSGGTFKLGEVKLLAPSDASKYVGIGLNFRKSAEKSNTPIPKIPIVFLKPTTSIIGPDDNIVLPPGLQRINHEGEIALVIGKKAKNVAEERAGEYLLGLTCTNDVSNASNFAEDGGNPTRTKGYDTFGPIGPWIETEMAPDDLLVETYVNGELRQSGSTSDLIFGINQIIHFVTSFMTLLPGDVVAMGTPPSPGALKAGDVVEVKVQGIGSLRNPVVGPDQGPIAAVE